MDGSSQNDGAQNKSPDQNTNGYQKYLDPVDKPRDKRRLIIIGGIVLSIIIILTIIVLALSHSKNNDQSQSTQNAQAVSCSDNLCFEQNFSNCTKTAPYTYDYSGSKLTYTITGNQDAGCTLDVEYLSGSLLAADTSGQKMTCEFDNSIDFYTAFQNILHFPDDFDCSGDLAGSIKDLNLNLNGS